jgi:hypothetical protein
VEVGEGTGLGLWLEGLGGLVVEGLVDEGLLVLGLESELFWVGLDGEVLVGALWVEVGGFLGGFGVRFEEEVVDLNTIVIINLIYK